MMGMGRLHIARGRKDQGREFLERAIACFERCEIETKVKRARDLVEVT